MKTVRISMLALVCVFAARADFSYTTTRKSAQGTMGAAPAGDATMKHYYRGQKMKTESATTATIFDLDAQTMTNINHQQKSYTVTKFSDLGQMVKDTQVEAQIDVKETGQKKNINGYNASEVVMTMSVDSPQARQAGMKMLMEMDMWVSTDVPGAADLRAFHQRNKDKFPWAAMMGGGGGGANAGMQKAMADMMKKMAAIGGVPVLQVVRMKTGGDGAQAAQMQQGMAQARAQLEQMAKSGGPGAAMAQQQLARMGAMSGSGGALFEITTESSGFSNAAIPDSIFEIPAGYQKK